MILHLNNSISTKIGRKTETWCQFKIIINIKNIKYAEKLNVHGQKKKHTHNDCHHTNLVSNYIPDNPNL